MENRVNRRENHETGGKTVQIDGINQETAGITVQTPEKQFKPSPHYTLAGISG
nr:hypothetical protein [Evansella caseinilytica]